MEDYIQLLFDELEKHNLCWDDQVAVASAVHAPASILALIEWLSAHPHATLDEMISEAIHMYMEYEVLTREPMPVLVEALKKHGLEGEKLWTVAAGLRHKKAILDMAAWVSAHPDAAWIELSKERYRLMKEYQYPSYSTKRRKALRSSIQRKQPD